MITPDSHVLFFDAGGTLLRPRDPIGVTYARVAERFGAALPHDLLGREFYSSFKMMQNRAAGSVPTNGEDHDWWRSVVSLALQQANLPPDFPFEEYFRVLYDHFAEPELWVPYPEVPSVLAELAGRGFSMAVLSNWDNRLRKVINGHNLNRYFEKLFISAEMGVAKPDPEIYRLARLKMSREVPKTLMIGDDPQNDTHAPEALGWDVFLVERPSITLENLLEILII